MKDKFVDRKKEMDQIRELLRDSENTRAHIILADGGLGKTRFLQEIERVVEREFGANEFKVFPRFDFDEGIPKDDPRNYFIYRLLSDHIISKKDADQLENDGLEASAGKLIAKNFPQRKILLFDTLEKLNDRRFKDTLFKILRNLTNGVIIFAGREPEVGNHREFDNFKERVQQELDPRFDGPITLKPFSKEDTIEYINTKEDEKGSYILQEVVDQLAVLSRGIPILVDLAADYVTNDINFRDLLEITPVQFEEKLVERLIRLKTPLDILILLLAEISPLSEEAIAFIFDTTLEKARADIISPAKTLSFIKTLPNKEIRLHDKMEDLIRDHILETNRSPIENRDRRIYFRNARDYFRKKDKELRPVIWQLRKQLESDKKNLALKYDHLRLKRDRQNATFKWSQYAFVVGSEVEDCDDAKDWWTLWHDTITRLRNGQYYELIHQMLLTVKSLDRSSFKYYLQPIESFTALNDPVRRYQFDLLWAINQRNLFKLNDAENSFKSLLEQYHNDENRKSNVLNHLGVVCAELGKQAEGLMYEQECLNLTSKSNDFGIAGIHNQIGYIYRLLEDDNPDALDNAEKHYEKALDALAKYKKKIDVKKLSAYDKEIISFRKASIWINLGYVKGLRKDYAGAYENIQDAIDTLESLFGEYPERALREIAKAETAKAILERDQGHLNRAFDLLRSAYDRAHYPEDRQQLCRITFHLGWTEWFQAEEIGVLSEKGLEKLYSAQDHLMKSAEYFQDLYTSREKPGVYHQLASVAWRLGYVYQQRGDQAKAVEFFQDARLRNADAIKFSKELHNNRYWIDAYVGEAEFDFAERKSTNMREYRDNIYKFEKDYPQFKLFYGRFRRIEADFLFEERDYDGAFELYADAMRLIAHSRQLSGPYNLDTELQNVRQKLQAMNEDDALRYCDKLHASWAQDVPEDENTLIKWVKDVKRYIELR